MITVVFLANMNIMSGDTSWTKERDFKLGCVLKVFFDSHYDVICFKNEK